MRAPVPTLRQYVSELGPLFSQLASLPDTDVLLTLLAFAQLVERGTCEKCSKNRPRAYVCVGHSEGVSVCVVPREPRHPHSHAGGSTSYPIGYGCAEHHQAWSLRLALFYAGCVGGCRRVWSMSNAPEARFIDTDKIGMAVDVYARRDIDRAGVSVQSAFLLLSDRVLFAPIPPMIEASLYLAQSGVRP